MIHAMLSIFLSHCHADKAFARQLSDALHGHGIGTWLDEAEIQVGDSLIQKIEVAIRECTYLGVILSPESVESEWVRREVEIALNDEIYGRRVKVLPLLYKPCQLPGFLAGKLYADFSYDFGTGFASLLAKLNADSSDSAQRGVRLRELLNRFQTWAAFGRKTEDLLYEESVEQALDSLPSTDVSVDMLDFLLSTMSQAVHRSTLIKPEWIRWINEVPHNVTIAGLRRVFDKGVASVRRGAARISGVIEANTISIVQKQLIREQDVDTKRRLMQSLDSKGGVSADLAASLANDDDWIVKMYAVKRSGKRPALLISDGTSFATEIGNIAASSGFHVATSGFFVPGVSEEFSEYDVLSGQELVMLVRGEHYIEVGHADLYRRLRDYVVNGGYLFATCWTSWENRKGGELRSVLPFMHVQDSHYEDRTVECVPTLSDDSKLFSVPHFGCRSSFELLTSKTDTVVLAEMTTGVSFFGYRAVGSGLCYYLNTCQHLCGGEMISPLDSSPQLLQSIERVMKWIASSRALPRRLS